MNGGVSEVERDGEIDGGRRRREGSIGKGRGLVLRG